jgi:osmotically-inducible protein OsmY
MLCGYLERAAAERVTVGVYGVRAVANELEIRLRDGQHRTDTAIAQSALSALKWNSQLPRERITVLSATAW